MRILMVFIASLLLFSCASTKKKNEAAVESKTVPAAKQKKAEIKKTKPAPKTSKAAAVAVPAAKQKKAEIKKTKPAPKTSKAAAVAVPAAKQKKAEIKKTKPAPKTSKAAAVAVTTCKIKGETRKLSIATPASGGCKLHYTKFGNENVIASAQNDRSYCEKIFDRVKGKLENAGFTCK